MKTTLELDDELLRRAKQVALDRGTTLRAVVEEALARALGPATPPVPIRTVVWPAVESGGRPAAPAEPEHAWLDWIKAVRYGDEAAVGKLPVEPEPVGPSADRRVPKGRKR